LTFHPFLLPSSVFVPIHVSDYHLFSLTEANIPFALPIPLFSLFGWLVADGWCWFVLREEYCWLVAGGWFVLREKYCWLMADKPSEQGGCLFSTPQVTPQHIRMTPFYPSQENLIFQFMLVQVMLPVTSPSSLSTSTNLSQVYTMSSNGFSITK
jgi:hypothetical protein